MQQLTLTQWSERLAYCMNWQFELREENWGDGHSHLFRLINPSPGKFGLGEARKIARSYVESARAPSLIPLVTLAAERIQANMGMPLETGWEAAISATARKYEHVFEAVSDPQLLHKRRVRRLIYLVWLMHGHGLGAHSRGVELMFDDLTILIGRSPQAPLLGAHREHVVPCAYVRDLLLKELDKHPLVVDGVEQTAALMRLSNLVARLPSLAHISECQRVMLDVGQNAMKQSMPVGWNPETGCIRVRLCGVGIDLHHAKDVPHKRCSTCPQGNYLESA